MLDFMALFKLAGIVGAANLAVDTSPPRPPPSCDVVSGADPLPSPPPPPPPPTFLEVQAGPTFQGLRLDIRSIPQSKGQGTCSSAQLAALGQDQAWLQSLLWLLWLVLAAA